LLTAVLSVRLSVTLEIYATNGSRYENTNIDRVMFLVYCLSGCQVSYSWVEEITPNESVKEKLAYPRVESKQEA